jgi:hypothetical protein
MRVCRHVATEADLELDVSKYIAALIRGDPVSIFKDSCPYIYGAWLSWLIVTADCSPLQAVVAAFDAVVSLNTENAKIYREISGCLPLRFGYVQLVWAIDAFNKEAEEAGRSCRKTYHTATISIDAYV